MTEYVCESCGQRNPAGTEFCVYCGAYLAWDAGASMLKPAPDPVDHETVDREPVARPVEQHPSGSARVEASEEETQTVLRPPPTAAELAAWSSEGVSDPAPAEAVDPTDGRFAGTVESAEVSPPVTGEPASLTLRLTNTSDIVDGYVVEAPDAPEWLHVDGPQLRLYPGTEEALTVQVSIASSTPVAAQELPLRLRVRSLGWAGAHLDVPVTVVVPVLDAPVTVRAEPRLLRVRDRGTAELTMVVDNAKSNRTARVLLAGSDPELAVRFRFDPPLLQIGPAATERARVHLTMPEPEPGQELARSITLTATEGARTAETTVTVQQATSARTEEPAVSLEVEPSLVRVRDATIGLARVVADNRRGSQWVQLQLTAADPERVVRVDFAHAQLRVPPGGTAHTEFRLQAPLPEAGTEVSRTVTLRASDGQRESSATATFVQAASVSPMKTLTVRLDPSVVRTRDTDHASVQVVLDNRRGHAAVRLTLEGSDPERAVHFGFTPPVVQVGPGQVQAVTLQLGAYGPAPSTEVTRQLTVSATDGRDTVESTGSWGQSSSQSAMETLTVRLDPSVVRMPSRRRTALTAIVDNTQGAQPVRVSLHGDNPENVVRFSFAPSALDVPPGRFARSVVTVRVPRAPVGSEVVRPIVIAASDGRTAAQSEGSLIQSSAERRPVARVIFTLLGALLMVIGTFQDWLAGTSVRGVDIDLGFAEELFGVDLNLGRQLAQILSLGLVILGFAVLVVFGLTGRSGRLTRWSAFFVATVLVALFVVLVVRGTGLLPAPGAFLVLIGCVLAYIGGLLIKRT